MNELYPTEQPGPKKENEQIDPNYSVVINRSHSEDMLKELQIPGLDLKGDDFLHLKDNPTQLALVEAQGFTFVPNEDPEKVGLKISGDKMNQLLDIDPSNEELAKAQSEVAGIILDWTLRQIGQRAELGFYDMVISGVLAVPDDQPLKPVMDRSLDSVLTAFNENYQRVKVDIPVLDVLLKKMRAFQINERAITSAQHTYDFQIEHTDKLKKSLGSEANVQKLIQRAKTTHPDKTYSDFPGTL